ncbi:MAG: D-lyxose/D-mannose family sugar isomerase [Chloroflexota bacterium]
MKRSEINAIINDAESFIRKNGFFLPPFAYWTAEEWQKKGAEVREIVDNQIGWDITDFGSGDFEKVGLAIITIRNGHPDNLKGKKGKTYAEKILIVGVNQITPMHFHWTKAEDIINRGGGELVIQLYNSTPAEKLDTENDVVVQCDGVTRTVKPGGFIHLKPGESITLLSGQYHKFWAEKERVMVGEVSVVNDDRTDNRFYEPIGRFPIIEEDVPPLYLLTEDYKNYYKGA